MAEVSGCVRRGAHKLCALQTLRTCHHRAHSHDASALRHRSRTAYYDILGVSPNATHAQIKSAYYKQSFRHHPDRNRGADAAQSFALVAEAYSVLGSSDLRRKYDRGILAESEVQSAGRPGASDSPRRRTRRAPGAHVNFDFDAFYQAHYGEQLERERRTRVRQEEEIRRQQGNLRKWKQGKMTEVTVTCLLICGGLLLLSLRS